MITGRVICVLIILSASAQAAPTFRETISMGTGFAVTFDGVAVTNHHVVDGCGAIRARVEVSPYYCYEASVVARDPFIDLAGIRLTSRVDDGSRRRRTPGQVPRAALREAPVLQLGEHAVASGFPLRGVLASAVDLGLPSISGGKSD